MQQSNKINPKQSNKTNPWQEKIFLKIKMAKTLILFFFSSHRYGDKLGHVDCNKNQTLFIIVFLSTLRLQ